MSSDRKPLRLSHSANWNVLEDDREIDMLAQGLSLADTIVFDKPKAKAPPAPRRRTLDDMRALSERIKATKAREE